jgi:hypothetical protein
MDRLFLHLEITMRLWNERISEPPLTKSIRARDLRATGTIYINIPLIASSLAKGSVAGMTSLDDWSVPPVLEIMDSSWKDQFSIIEQAFRDLVRLLRTRPVSCSAERGQREFQRVKDSPDFWQVDVTPA